MTKLYKVTITIQDLDSGEYIKILDNEMVEDLEVNINRNVEETIYDGCTPLYHRMGPMKFSVRGNGTRRCYGT
jgi:hypothetical protein